MRKDIDKKIEYLKELTGYNLDYEYSQPHGGYRLIRMKEDGRQSSEVFGIHNCSERLTAKKFSSQLDNIIGTIHEMKKCSTWNN